MKKMLSIVLFAGMAIMFAVTACKTPIDCTGMVVNNREKVTYKWLNDNTFLIVGRGSPIKDETDEFVRESQAKEAAEIDAQTKVIQKLVGVKVEGAAGIENFRLKGSAAAKEFVGNIKGGATCQVNYTDKQDCLVVYAVEAVGLKQMAAKVKAESAVK